MSITEKVLILLSSVFLLISAAGYLIQYQVIMPNFIELEKLEAKLNIRRVEHAIDNKILFLDNITHDWASWDESYNFVQTKDHQFIDINLTEETFINLKLDFVIFVDLEKEVVWGKASNLQQHQSLRGESFIKNMATQLVRLSEFLPSKVNNSDQHIMGIYIYQNLPLLISSRALLTSKYQGPATGYLFFGQFIDQVMLDEISKQTEVNYNLEVVSNKNSSRNYVFNPVNAQQLQIATTINSLNSDQALKITANITREITQGGQASLNYALLSLITVLFSLIVVVAFLLRHIIITPIQLLTKLISDILRLRNYSLHINSTRKDEIGQLEQQFNNLLTQIESDQQQLVQLACTDKLTQLSNRLELDKVLKKQWVLLKRKKLPMSIIMLDLDLFKLYNDFYGHQLGDQCLRTVAQVLKDSLQRPTDLAARYGGEEFILVLPDTDHEGALIVAANIQKRLEAQQINHPQSKVSQWVTSSIGVATTIPTLGLSYESLIGHADKALYLAKQQGRNQICSYHEVVA